MSQAEIDRALRVLRHSLCVVPYDDLNALFISTRDEIMRRNGEKLKIEEAKRQNFANTFLGPEIVEWIARGRRLIPVMLFKNNRTHIVTNVELEKNKTNIPERVLVSHCTLEYSYRYTYRVAPMSLKTFRERFSEALKWKDVSQVKGNICQCVRDNGKLFN